MANNTANTTIIPKRKTFVVVVVVIVVVVVVVGHLSLPFIRMSDEKKIHPVDKR